MQGNKSKNTLSELAVRKLLHARGLRYRVNVRPLPSFSRTADIVFTKLMIAVFIDGCFWHGCPDHYTEPKANVEYWRPKIARNVERDAETRARLEAAGWTVVRYWAHQKPEEVADEVIRVVRSARP